MRRVLIIATALVALGLTSVSAQSATTIVAGQAVGAIRIGANINEAIAVLGNLYDTEDSDSGKHTIYDWPLRPLLIIADKESGRVVLIGVALSDQFRTDKGITAGSERQTVETAYGREFEATEGQALTRLVYDSQGIAFFVGKLGVMKDRVTQIFVFAPSQWKTLTEGL